MKTMLKPEKAHGCDNCGKRGHWQIIGTDKNMAYELAECHHYPKPVCWRNSGPVRVARGCGSKCPVWVSIEMINNKGKE